MHRYLRAHGDHGCSNWLSMQYNGLGTLGVVLPELDHAADWLEHAEVRLSSGSARMQSRVKH